MSKRGFGSGKISRQRQQEIAALGGKAAQLKGTAHRWTSETAAQAADIARLNRERRQAEEKRR